MVADDGGVSDGTLAVDEYVAAYGDIVFRVHIALFECLSTKS